MEGLSGSEYTLWLGPRWNLLASLGDLLDTITAVGPLVVEGGTFRARVHDGSTAQASLRLVCLLSLDRVSEMDDGGGAAPCCLPFW